jgi:hypothetical protein
MSHRPGENDLCWFLVAGSSGDELEAATAAEARLIARTLVMDDGNESAEITRNGRWYAEGCRDASGRYLLKSTQGAR